MSRLGVLGARFWVRQSPAGASEVGATRQPVEEDDTTIQAGTVTRQLTAPMTLFVAFFKTVDDQETPQGETLPRRRAQPTAIRISLQGDPIALRNHAQE